MKKKTNIFREYWYLWLIVAILPFAVYGLIILPLGFNHIGGDSAPTVWLGFWGGYLGAIISAGVAFFILDKQLKANAKENEYNRLANEEVNRATQLANDKQNEKNRQLQLNQIKYQQESQWLNGFKNVVAEYTNVFNNNNLVVAQNNLYDNPDRSYDITRDIFDKMQIAKTKMNLQNRNDENADELDSLLTNAEAKFMSVVSDIHILSNCIIIHHNPNDPRDPFTIQSASKQRVLSNKDSSDELKLFAESKTGLTVDDMVGFAMTRRKSVEGILKDVPQALVIYVNKEQERINNILLQ